MNLHAQMEAVFLLSIGVTSSRIVQTNLMKQIALKLELMITLYKILPLKIEMETELY
jgi:hypothetical protein